MLYEKIIAQEIVNIVDFLLNINAIIKNTISAQSISPEYEEIISGKFSIFLDNSPNIITIIVNIKYNNLFLFKQPLPNTLKLLLIKY